jgi:urease accessory protein UreF
VSGSTAAAVAAERRALALEKELAELHLTADACAEARRLSQEASERALEAGAYTRSLFSST